MSSLARMMCPCSRCGESYRDSGWKFCVDAVAPEAASSASGLTRRDLRCGLMVAVKVIGSAGRRRGWKSSC